MSIKTTIAALALGALVASGSLAAATSAEARDFHGDHGSHEDRGFHDDHDFRHDRDRRFFNDGFDHDSYYYNGYGYCHWVPRFDIFHNYIGRVRSCGY